MGNHLSDAHQIDPQTLSPRDYIRARPASRLGTNSNWTRHSVMMRGSIRPRKPFGNDRGMVLTCSRYGTLRRDPRAAGFRLLWVPETFLRDLNRRIFSGARDIRMAFSLFLKDAHGKLVGQSLRSCNQTLCCTQEPTQPTNAVCPGETHFLCPSGGLR